MKRAIHLLILAIFFSAIGGSSLCAQSDPEQKLGAWYSVFSNHRLSENWSIYNETNLNLYEMDSDLDQFWIITGLRRYLKNNITASISYSYFYTDPNYDQGTNDELFGENRIFEQLAFNHTYGKIKLQHRYRLEHRIFDSKVSKVVTNRFRYRLALVIPLTDRWFLQLADELFINFNENIFNQNRLIGNLGFKITPQLDFRTGYMKLHTSDRKFDRLLFTVNFSTDWRKPNEN